LKRGTATIHVTVDAIVKARKEATGREIIRDDHLGSEMNENNEDEKHNRSRRHGNRGVSQHEKKKKKKRESEGL